MLELDDTMMGVIGILAGILILSGWIPQIAKGYRTKKLTDVSSYLMILIFVGATLWLIYGMALDDVYIMGVNLAAMFLTMLLLAMKLKYEKNAQRTSEYTLFVAYVMLLSSSYLCTISVYSTWKFLKEKFFCGLIVQDL